MAVCVTRNILSKGLTRDRSSTQSLAGSEIEHRVENGRKYANETYFMPNDEKEQIRLAIAHQTFLLLLEGQLTFSRLQSNVERILEVGAGTGDWAVAMGERYPDAEVVATDINGYQPINAPPNVSFYFDDAQQTWTFTDPFDFIHIRGLNGAISNWPELYANAFRHLKQGGIIEVADFGVIKLMQQSARSYVSIYNEALQSAAEKAGIPLGLQHLKRNLLESAGFSVVRAVVMDIPLGTWSPDPEKRATGKMALISILEGLEAMSMRLLTRELSWTVEEVKDLCDKVQEEITRPNAQASVQCQFMVAKKLLLPDEAHEILDFVALLHRNMILKLFVSCEENQADLWLSFTTQGVLYVFSMSMIYVIGHPFLYYEAELM